MYKYVVVVLFFTPFSNLKSVIFQLCFPMSSHLVGMWQKTFLREETATGAADSGGYQQEKKKNTEPIYTVSALLL